MMGKGFDSVINPGGGGTLASIKNLPSYYAKSAAEAWRYDVDSGNLETFIEKKELIANGTPTYGVSGPSGTGLIGIRAEAAGDYFTQSDVPTSYDIPANKPFVFILQILHDNNVSQGALATIIDAGFQGGSSEGWAVYISSTVLDFNIRDSLGNTHITRYTHGGIIWKDETFYTLRWVFRPNLQKGNLFVKEAGQDEFEAVTTLSSDPFSSIQGVTVSDDEVRMFAQENDGSNGFLGTKFQDVLQIGSTAFKLPLVP